MKIRIVASGWLARAIEAIGDYIGWWTPEEKRVRLEEKGAQMPEAQQGPVSAFHKEDL